MKSTRSNLQISTNNNQFNIDVVVYSRKIEEANEAHEFHRMKNSFYANSYPVYITLPVGRISLDVKNCNFAQLRELLQYGNNGSMKRTSMLFQEVLFIMERQKIIYNCDFSERFMYRIGFVHKETKLIRLISLSDESKYLASQISASDFFQSNLIIIPFSQIPPDERSQ